MLGLKSHSNWSKDSSYSENIQPPSPFVKFFNEDPKKKELSDEEFDSDIDDDDDDDDDDFENDDDDDDDIHFQPRWNSTFNENDPDLHLSDTNSRSSKDSRTFDAAHSASHSFGGGKVQSSLDSSISSNDSEVNFNPKWKTNRSLYSTSF